MSAYLRETLNKSYLSLKASPVFIHNIIFPVNFKKFTIKYFIEKALCIISLCDNLNKELSIVVYNSSVKSILV